MSAPLTGSNIYDSIGYVWRKYKKCDMLTGCSYLGSVPHPGVFMFSAARFIFQDKSSMWEVLQKDCRLLP